MEFSFGITKLLPHRIEQIHKGDIFLKMLRSESFFMGLKRNFNFFYRAGDGFTIEQNKPCVTWFTYTYPEIILLVFFFQTYMYSQKENLTTENSLKALHTWSTKPSGNRILMRQNRYFLLSFISARSRIALVRSMVSPSARSDL